MGHGVDALEAASGGGGVGQIEGPVLELEELAQITEPSLVASGEDGKIASFGGQSGHQTAGVAVGAVDHPRHVATPESREARRQP